MNYCDVFKVLPIGDFMLLCCYCCLSNLLELNGIIIMTRIFCGEFNKVGSCEILSRNYVIEVK